MSVTKDVAKRGTSFVAPTVDLKYYNYDKLMSFNAKFNFLVGARGLGKSYGLKVAVVRWAIKDGRQFIYLRRYKEELAEAKSTFFADFAHVYPAYDFRVNGAKAEMAPIDTRDTKKREWTVIGHFMALSQSQNVKSSAYPLVTTIMFDEFIIEKGTTTYIANEAQRLEGLFMTVDRWKDKTRVFLLANSVTITNPYFLFYNIRPDESEEYLKLFEDSVTGIPFVACHFADSAEFKSGVYATQFGRFMKQREDQGQANYAVENQFSDNHKKLLAEKPSHARYRFTIETAHGTFSVWVDMEVRFWYIQESRPKQETIYTLLPDRMDTDRVLIEYNSKLLQYMRADYNKGHAFFDTPKTRNAFIEIFRK